MSRARTSRRPAQLPIPKIEESFYAYEPATATTAARLLVVHRWSNLPGGRGEISDPRHCVTIWYIVRRAVVGSAIMPSENEARKRYAKHVHQLARYEITVVQARDVYAEITGASRFSQCSQCSNALKLAALWCTECGHRVPDNPPAQARAELVGA